MQLIDFHAQGRDQPKKYPSSWKRPGSTLPKVMKHQEHILKHVIRGRILVRNIP